MCRDDECIIDLACAVLTLAMYDYAQVLEYTDNYIKRDRAASLEKFFLSEYGQALSFGNGQLIIDTVRKNGAGKPFKISAKMVKDSD